MLFEIILYICYHELQAMVKNYSYILLFFLCMATISVSAQESKHQPRVQENTIEGLNFYPNPVTNGKIYITSKSNDDKQITIFDVLGKKVLQTILTSKELNVASLSPGVYFIKIEEGDTSATRKLIVR